ncbi:hypothetical protein [Corynebacterium appendicis]|uniref:hypothetical protein n=1 Tax=Corynebacterium appendicis TaxID=163202 RepID=UPI002352F199|nr:hypothetical protein [Corynebacterium appendicis]
MNVDAIITHLSNFQDTWKGWNDLISGLTGFFGANPVEKLKDFFSEGTFESLSSLSSSSEQSSLSSSSEQSSLSSDN